VVLICEFRCHRIPRLQPASTTAPSYWRRSWNIVRSRSLLRPFTCTRIWRKATALRECGTSQSFARKIDLAGLRGMIDSLGRFEGSVPGDCSASAGTTSHDGIGPRVANLAKRLRLGGRARGGQRAQKRITRLRRRLLAFVIKANPECFDHDGRLASGCFPARIPPEATDLHWLMRRSGMQTRS
jgi:hypothetical protein